MDTKKQPVKAIVGQFLKSVREREGLTQTALAKAADVLQDQVARAESINEDDPLPRLDMVARILSGAGYELQLRAIKKTGIIETTV